MTEVKKFKIEALTVSVVGGKLLSLLSRCQAAGRCVIHRGKALSSCVIRHRRGTFAHSRPYIRHNSIHDSKVFMAWWLHKSSLFNNTTLMMFGFLIGYNCSSNSIHRLSLAPAVLSPFHFWLLLICISAVSSLCVLWDFDTFSSWRLAGLIFAMQPL